MTIGFVPLVQRGSSSLTSCIALLDKPAASGTRGCTAGQASSGTRRGIGEFRADRHQIAGHRQIERARGLDGDVPAGVVQGRGQGNQFGKQHRLAAGKDDVLRRLEGG